MIRRIRLAAAGGALVALLLLGACSATPTISLNGDLSGEARVAVAIAPPMVAYLTDLVATLGPGATLLDGGRIAGTLAERPGIDPVAVTTAEDASGVDVTVRFDNLPAAVAAAALDDVVTVARRGRTVAIRVVVSRDSVLRLLEVAEIDPTVAAFLLPWNDEVTADEYRDSLTWALEEYLDGDGGVALFDGAVVEATIDVAGRVTAVVGGVRTDTGVRFVVPLIDALTTPGGRTVGLDVALP